MTSWRDPQGRPSSRCSPDEARETHPGGTCRRPRCTFGSRGKGRGRWRSRGTPGSGTGSCGGTRPPRAAGCCTGGGGREGERQCGGIYTLGRMWLVPRLLWDGVVYVMRCNVIVISDSSYWPIFIYQIPSIDLISFFFIPSVDPISLFFKFAWMKTKS